MNGLKKITLQRCPIETIIGLKYCKNLEELSISTAVMLSEISFPEPMNSLKNITLKEHYIKKIIGLELCPKIDIQQFKKDNPSVQLIPAVKKSELNEKIKALGKALNNLKNRITELKNSLGILKSSM